MNVYDFAVDIERHGKAFFEEMSSKHNNPRVKSIFNMVAQDEGQILRKIDEMMTLMAVTPSLSSLNEEVMAQGRDLLEQSITEVEAMSVQTDEDAYQFVVKAEQQICELFLDLGEREEDLGSKKVLQAVGSFNCREAVQLRQLHDFIHAPDTYLAWGEFSNIGEFHNFGRDVE